MRGDVVVLKDQGLDLTNGLGEWVAKIPCSPKGPR